MMISKCNWNNQVSLQKTTAAPRSISIQNTHNTEPAGGVRMGSKRGSLSLWLTAAAVPSQHGNNSRRHGFLACSTDTSNLRRTPVGCDANRIVHGSRRAAAAKHQSHEARGGFPFGGANPAALIYSRRGWLVPLENKLIATVFETANGLCGGAPSPPVCICVHWGALSLMRTSASDDALACKSPNALIGAVLARLERCLGPHLRELLKSHPGYFHKNLLSTCCFWSCRAAGRQHEIRRKGNRDFSSCLPLFMPQKPLLKYVIFNVSSTLQPESHF